MHSKTQHHKNFKIKCKLQKFAPLQIQHGFILELEIGDNSYREGEEGGEESSLIIPGDLGKYALQNGHKLFRWNKTNNSITNNSTRVIPIQYFLYVNHFLKTYLCHQKGNHVFYTLFNEFIDLRVVLFLKGKDRFKYSDKLIQWIYKYRTQPQLFKPKINPYRNRKHGQIHTEQSCSCLYNQIRACMPLKYTDLSIKTCILEK